MRVSLTDLRRFLSESIILVEGRLEDVIARYPEDEETVRLLAQNDPSGNLKYLAWMSKQAITLKEPAEEVTSLVRDFEMKRTRLPQKDINSYRTLGDLRSAVESIGASETSKKREISQKEADVIFRDDRFLLVRPKTEAASCKFGPQMYVPGKTMGSFSEEAWPGSLEDPDYLLDPGREQPHQGGVYILSKFKKIRSESEILRIKKILKKTMKSYIDPNDVVDDLRTLIKKPMPSDWWAEP
jgi:hypothetical protein